MESEKNNEETKDRSHDDSVQELLTFRPLMFSHTPIIITDGSASVGFERTPYVENGAGEFLGNRLRLSQVELLDKNPQQNDHISICARLDPAKRYRVTVLCASKDFEVTDLGGSVKIKFDRTEYPEVATTAARRKFLKATRQIMGVKIEDISVATPVLVHQCRLVPGNGSCQVTIYDSHI